MDRQHATCRESCFNHERLEGLQNENSLDVVEAIVRASLLRQESRGAMYRLDYPETDNDRWLCNLVIQRRDGEWRIEEVPVNPICLALPAGRRPYGRKGEKDLGS
jgi:succinate dehydrogenase/fumarate reductase flavoprotein subunit